jgi:hypothetical protein
MGVSDEAKNVIPLKFLRKIKKKFFPSCKLNPGTYCIRHAKLEYFAARFCKSLISKLLIVTELICTIDIFLCTV